MRRVSSKILLTAIMLIGLISFTGCRKPYDTPEFVTIEASQTAFLIPLVGDTSDQASFASEELLEQAKVATKEIQIPHRWVQTGRKNWQGEWRDSATLIIVERKPVSRSWESGATATESGNAIWGETSDGIGVYVGMSCSAQINEEDATKFLYRYNHTPLESIIDDQIKTMVKDEFNLATGKYSSTDLHAHKEEIMNTVKSKVISHFKEYGITITVLGMNEGLSFENEDIQKAIDEKFASEQKLVTQQNENAVALAKAEAEAKTAKIKAQADAEAAKIVAEAEAEVLRIESEAEAKANRVIAESLTDSLVELRKYELFAEKWIGSFPTVMGESGTSFMDITRMIGE